MNKFKSLLIVCSGMTVLASCGKLLDIKPQTAIYDEQINELINSGDEKVADLLASMYTGMMGWMNQTGKSASASSESRYNSLQGMDYMRNLEGNDIVFGNATSGGAFGQSEYDLEDFRGWRVDKNSFYWYGAWGPISEAHQTLRYMTKEAAAANPKFADGRARCLLVRAYNYMCLMENYQDAYTNGGKDKKGMPLYDKYDPAQDVKPRSTATETYKFIMDDINEAIELLGKAGIGYTADTEDFDLALANFLKARVALWTGDWTTCINACTDIINKGGYSFIPETNYGAQNTGEKGPNGEWKGETLELFPETNAFLAVKANPEAIVAFGRNSSFLKTTIFYSWLSATARSQTSGQALIDDRLYDKIAADDFRKECFRTEAIGAWKNNDGADVMIAPYASVKFTATEGLGGDGVSHIGKENNGNVEYIKFRYSEVVLMKAEAQAQNNDAAGAKATLNTLLAARTKAGAPTLTCDNYPSMAGLSALQMVQLQSRIELWGEGGREYYNNKRWGIPVDRTGSKVHYTNKTLAVSDMTLEIPEQEILYGCGEQN